MNINRPYERYQQALKESELHINHLNHALSSTQTIFPMTIKKVQELSLDEVGAIDQLVFRFIRLQDCIGQKLFHSGLSLLGEPVEQMTMLDKLHRLEKIRVIENSDQWLFLRELRNNFTHDYPEEEAYKADALNELRKASFYLIEVYKNFSAYINKVRIK